MFRNLLITTLAALSAIVAHAQNSRQPFRAAVVKVNITPDNAQWLRGYNPRLSTEVLDSLYHRIVVLDDGNTQFYLISSDILGMPSAEYKKVISMLKKRIGINLGAARR